MLRHIVGLFSTATTITALTTITTVIFSRCRLLFWCVFYSLLCNDRKIFLII